MDLSVEKLLHRAKKLMKAGKFPEARKIYKEILARFPQNRRAKEGYDKLQPTKTIKSPHQTSELLQDHLQELINLYNRGRVVEVLLKAKELFPLFPKNVDLLNILGATNVVLQKFDEAIKFYKRALKVEPGYPGTYLNIGTAFKRKGDVDAALESYQKATEIKPEYVEAHLNMGNAFNKLGKIDKSIECCEKVLKIKPNYQIAIAQKLYRQAHICDWAEIETNRKVISKLGISGEFVDPLSLMPFEDAPDRHRKRAEVYAKNNLKGISIPFPSVPTKKSQKLRIGYFSSDFRDHSVAYAIADIFGSHNRDRFKIYAYSFGPGEASKMRKKIIESVDVFNEVTEMSDRDVALLARQDKIDIAIDLNGYTEGSRSDIFAFRAAPIQMHFWGTANSSGTNNIDYIISDDLAISQNHEHFYNESIIHLPEWIQAKYFGEQISKIPITRSEMGLPEKSFVFCYFSNSYKISSSEFDIWMRVLNKIKGSVLWIYKSNEWMEKHLKLEANKRGVNAERLVFAEKKPHPVHLARHKLADLFLDTFNVNAGVTAGDALWLGLPVVTKLGKGAGARTGGSLLKSLRLPELITKTEKEYEDLLLCLANNPERLNKIKKKLIRNCLVKPLFNSELFSKYLEEGYLQAYQRYFEGKNPRSINIAKDLQ